jgi:hypothetical protein
MSDRVEVWNFAHFTLVDAEVKADEVALVRHDPEDRSDTLGVVSEVVASPLRLCRAEKL